MHTHPGLVQFCIFIMFTSPFQRIPKEITDKITEALKSGSTTPKLFSVSSFVGKGLFIVIQSGVQRIPLFSIDNFVYEGFQSKVI